MGTAGDLFGGSGTSDLDLVAGENLTVGDAVSLGIDGKAYKSIGLLNNSSIPSPLPLATTTRYLLDTVANKIIALGISSTSTTSLYTSVGTVSASGALTWGTVTTHTMASGIGASNVFWDAVRQSNNQLFLAYNNGTLRTRIIEYSGTTTTAGTEVSTTATNITVASTIVMNLVADSSGRVLVAWFRNTTTFTLWGARATVSGTTITLGTETQINISNSPLDTGSQAIEMLYDSTQDRIVIFSLYRTGTANYLPEYTLINISTSIVTVASANLFLANITNQTYRIGLSRLSGTSSYLIRYVGSSSTESRARAFTISTTAFTLGTEITLTQNANDIQTANWVEDTLNNKIIFGFGFNGCAVYTRSGTTLTLQSTDTNIDFSETTLNFFSPYVIGAFSSLQQIYDFSGVIPRQVGTLSIYTSALTAQARLLTSTSGISYSIEREAATKLGTALNRNFIAGKITNENQLGVSTQTVSSGATAKIRLRFNKSSPAKMVTGLSGLTPAVHYYVNASGIRELAGVTYLGYAESATELVLANPSGGEN